MAYFVLELDPIMVGDNDFIRSYFANLGASGFASNMRIREKVVGSATHVMVHLRSSMDPGLGIIDGPLSPAEARAYIVANGW